MDFFEKEMRTLFGDNTVMSDLKFTGKTMLGRLDENKLCKLHFVTTGTAGKYTAIQSTIINSNDGVIDKQLFKFFDIIGYFCSSLSDKIEPYMWDYNKPEWYTKVSQSDKAKIADTVLEYVEMFQDQSYAMGMQFK